MRIALFAEFYYPHLGGVTEHVHNLAVQFNAAGHRAIVVTSDMGERAPEEDEVPVVRIGTSRVVYSSGSFARVTTGWGLGRQIEALLRRERIDVVHLHGPLTPTFGIVVPPVARRLGIPIVATFHSWFPRSALYRMLRRPLQRRLDWHAANIAVSVPAMEAHARYFEAEWDIIPNGVDIDFFTPEARLPRGDAGPQLLFLARLDPRNGLETALRAFERIVNRRPDAWLTVVGDGPLRAHYERLARPAGPRVRFVGAANGNRPGLYANADVYLCPTTKASFGITLLEAMASGVPQIVSDVTGFRELVNGGEEAMLAPINDPDAWAETALALIEDPARRARMGSVGRAKALTYAWPLVAERVMGVYRRVAR